MRTILIAFHQFEASDDYAMAMQELLACRGYMRLWWARLAGVAASQMLLVAIGCRCTT